MMHDAPAPLRAAVIGIGSMGWNHARILSSMPGVTLIGVVDFDKERLTKASESFSCKGYTSVEAVLAERPDFVVVATPNEHHAPVGVQCLKAGAHVLIEKPIAGTIEDALALIAAAKSEKRLLMVGQVERFNPAVQAAKRACAGQRIHSIQITRVGPFPPRMSQIGVVIDLGVHDIDIVRTIAESEIVDVQAQIVSTRGVREDTALLQFRTANDVIAQVNTNWITPFKTRRLEIATESKYIVADLITRQVNEFFDYDETGSFRTRPVFVALVEPLREELASFAAAIRTGSPPAISGEDGLRNLEVALECLRAGSGDVRKT